MLMSIQNVSNVLLLLLLPYAFAVVLSGKPPQHWSWPARYFDAVPLLRSVSDKAFISLCIGSIARDARLFGLVGDDAKDVLTLGLGIPFCVIVFSFLALVIHAVTKVHFE